MIYVYDCLQKLIDYVYITFIMTKSSLWVIVMYWT